MEDALPIQRSTALPVGKVGISKRNSPKTNAYPLKNAGWKTNVPFEIVPFQVTSYFFLWGIDTDSYKALDILG